MKIFAPAKVNFGLKIVNKRSDGYHNIDTIMQSLDLYDELWLEKKDADIELSGMDNLSLEDNLIYKAWKKVCLKLNKNLGVRIKINKKIPMAAGLAGGSSDAAMAIRGLNEMYGLELSKSDMADILKGIGADLPFCIYTGTYRAGGIGERLKKLKNPNFNILLLNPGYEVSTKSAYENLEGVFEKSRMDDLEKALLNRDFKLLKESMANDLETYVLRMHPDLSQIKERMRAYKGISLLSGSGPTVFGIYEDEVSLNAAYTDLKRDYKLVFKTRTIDEI
ncbi:4-(cytidine 5'-diphospho)-2-C-methyl-D-erythritol kinase [Peptoniphilus sp. GNH]|nr:4-(cytidine 5'-diphospho)-2-C-methyl-D-erythritol kinase [Clostridiales bacterium KA00134]UHR02103.1 4-(cytidine 5'-diphospho)-2-C-methyl-D-erythritol kinase [Peptoniphilus sp. GNH]